MKNELLDLNFYSHIKEVLELARKKTYTAINFAIGEKLIGKLERALLKSKAEMKLQSMVTN